MLVPHLRYLPLLIEVLEELESVRLPDFSLGFITLGNLHVHNELDVGLRKVQDEVHLVCTPSIDY